jgi:ubiquitin thioesterase protein OTUB1
VLKKLKDAKPFLIKAGFEGMVFEDMLEMVLQKLDDPKMTTIEEVTSLFCDAELSNYIILVMRFLTSGELKNNAILYETFIDNGLPIEFFCQTEVEPLDKEADQIQIMALLNYLDVAIKILYLDSNVQNKEATTMLLPESAKP